MGLMCFVGIGLLTWSQGLLGVFVSTGVLFEKICLGIMICNHYAWIYIYIYVFIKIKQKHKMIAMLSASLTPIIALLLD